MASRRASKLGMRAFVASSSVLRLARSILWSILKRSVSLYVASKLSMISFRTPRMTSSLHTSLITVWGYGSFRSYSSWSCFGTPRMWACMDAEKTDTPWLAIESLLCAGCHAIVGADRIGGQQPLR